jgi:hypothetical protein
MPGAAPLIDDNPGGNPSMFGAAGVASAGPLSGSAGGSVGYGSQHPTHMWYAAVMLGALIGVVFFHVSGFRFATDVGVTRG